MLVRIHQQERNRKTGTLRLLPIHIAFGRGGVANNHEGNKRFRKVIAAYKRRYLSAPLAVDRKSIIKEVQSHLKASGFIFVEKKNDGMWFEAPEKKSRNKIAQALREGASQAVVVMKAMAGNHDIIIGAGSDEEAAPLPEPQVASPQGKDVLPSTQLSNTSESLSTSLGKSLTGELSTDESLSQPQQKVKSLENAVVEDDDFDTVPLPVDYYSVELGTLGTSNGFDLEEHVDILLDLFGLLPHTDDGKRSEKKHD